MPTFPIIHRGEVAYFTDLDKPLIEATGRAIESRKQELTTRFRDDLHLDQSQTKQLSLVLFGDVLFDRWQTGHVRKEFLLGYPPPRNGLQFYLTALEKVPGKIGSLGIYTHAEQRYGEMTLVTYGTQGFWILLLRKQPQMSLEYLELMSLLRVAHQRPRLTSNILDSCGQASRSFRSFLRATMRSCPISQAVFPLTCCA